MSKKGLKKQALTTIIYTLDDFEKKFKWSHFGKKLKNMF